MAGDFDYEKLMAYFMGEIRTAHHTKLIEKAQEYIQPKIETKLAEFVNNLEVVTELKSVIELAFRQYFSELLEGANTRGGNILDVGIELLIEMSLWCAKEGLVDPPTIFLLFEDLFDSQTIDGCQHLFFLLESRASSLANDMFVGEKGRGRNLLLKVCTDLLRRLSKTNNAEFCGRILIFLAYVFPLSDRSGLNVKSDYNIANITTFETVPEGDKMDVDKAVEVPVADNSNGPIDYNFYRTFWSLHTYFQNFQILFQHPEKWTTLIKSIELVLTAFAGNSNLAEVQAQNQQHFTKYLTSSNLMKLQLKDSSFRRHILLQILILFQALTVPHKIPNVTALKDKQRHTIQELTEKVKELLEGTHPNGPEFTQTVFDILQRENNWITWKRDMCRPFEKQSMASPSLPLLGSGKVAAKRVVGAKVRLGNAELSRLWNLAKDDHEFLSHASRAHTPSVDEFLGPIEDGSYKAFNEEATKLYTWKALRLVAKNKFRYFGELHGTSASIEDLAKILEKEKNGPEQDSTAVIDETPEVDVKDEDTEMKESSDSIKIDSNGVATEDSKATEATPNTTTTPTTTTPPTATPPTTPTLSTDETPAKRQKAM